MNKIFGSMSKVVLGIQFSIVLKHCFSETIYNNQNIFNDGDDEKRVEKSDRKYVPVQQ